MRVENNTPKSKPVYKSRIDRARENMKKRMAPHINDKKEKPTPIQNTPIQRRPCMWNGSLMTSSKPKPKPKLPIKPVEVEDESSDDGYCKTHMYYTIKEKEKREKKIFSSSAIRDLYNFGIAKTSRFAFPSLPKKQMMGFREMDQVDKDIQELYKKHREKTTK